MFIYFHLPYLFLRSLSLVKKSTVAVMTAQTLVGSDSAFLTKAGITSLADSTQYEAIVFLKEEKNRSPCVCSDTLLEPLLTEVGLNRNVRTTSVCKKITEFNVALNR